MSDRYLIPAKGLLVRDPVSMAPLPPEGAAVRGHDDYWTRRISDGDVSERRDAKKPNAPKETT